MHKFKIFLIVIGSLVTLLGIVIIVFSVINHKYDLTKYVDNTYEINEEFNSFDISLDISDVTINYSDTEKCIVECKESDKFIHNVEVKDNTLVVTNKDDRQWYEKFFINPLNFKIIISLPKSITTYDKLKVTTSTGDFTLKDSTTFNDINIHASTGNVTISSVKTNNYYTKLSTGNINLTDVNVVDDLTIELSTGITKLDNVISNKMKVTSSTGDIIFNNSDAHNIEFHASTGDIKGSLLTGKQFSVSTSTGRVSVPTSTGSDTCNVTTSTGDISIKVL